MDIAIGSKWQDKDGAIVKVSDVVLWKNAFDVIEYQFEDNQCGVATRVEFLSSFKPCEPVYEYQWVLIKNGEVNRFDWGEWYSESDVRGKGEWVKIEETKRERK